MSQPDPLTEIIERHVAERMPNIEDDSPALVLSDYPLAQLARWETPIEDVGRVFHLPEE